MGATKISGINGFIPDFGGTCELIFHGKKFSLSSFCKGPIKARYSKLLFRKRELELVELVEREQRELELVELVEREQRE